MRFLILTVLAALSTLMVQSASKPTPKLPEVGKPAPALRLNDHQGNVVALDGKRKNWSVVAFFPKAATPG